MQSVSLPGTVNRGPAASREPFPFAVASRAMALLAATSASLALLAGRLADAAPLGAYLAKNFSLPGERQRLVIAVAAGVGVALACSLTVLVAWGRRAVAPLERVAMLASPLALACALPALFSYTAWYNEPLPYLLLLAGFTLTLEATVRRAGAAMPGVVVAGVQSVYDRVPRALTRHAPLALVVAGAAYYALYTGYFSILMHRRLATSGYDLGIYDNLMYNAMYGHFFRAPVLFGPTGGNYIAGHAEFAMLFFLPLYVLKPGAELLLGLQSAMMGFAAVPLYLFARTQIPRWSAALVALAYLLFAPLHGPNFYDFHWLATAVLFHFILYFALATRRDWLAAAMVVLLFLTREDIGVGLAVLGGFLLLTGVRPRAGALMAGSAVVWFTIDKFVIMPHAGSWWFANLYKDLIAEGESGYGSVIKTILVNPVFLVSTLCTQTKLVYAMHMLAPFALLPLRWPALALFILPGFFFTLMTTEYGPTVSIAFQYTTHWVPYLFLAVVLALRLLGRGEGGVVRRRAALTALTFGVVSQSYIFGAILQRHTFVGGFQRVTFGMTDVERRHYADVLALTALIPREASVAATERLNPHVSTRLTAFTLKSHHGDADYLFLDRSQIGFSDTRRVLKDAFKRNSYGLVASRDDEFYLFRRDYTNPETEGVVKSMGLTPE